MSSFRAGIRTSRGQAMAEGAAIMVVMAMLAILATLLIINVGLAVYYKQKMSFAACQAAQIAVDESSWNNAIRPGVSKETIESNTKLRLQKLLTGLGLPPATDSQVDLTDTGVRVKLKISNLQLIKSGVLPSFISLEETAEALYAINQPPGLLVLRRGDGTRMTGYNESVVIPVYGRFNLGLTDPELRGANVNTAQLPPGVALLKANAYPSRQFDMHVSDSSCTFFDRSTSLAQSQRDQYIRQHGLR